MIDLATARRRVAEQRPLPPSGAVDASRGHAMQALRALVERIAPSMISVLVLGETGVGKELLAESIHRASRRAGRPFLKLNCAALSESLLESELFGHERGSFTGATATKDGLLETADGGTVFLDEVGEMPLAIQAKLLRVIEDRAMLPVGGLKTRSIDVRFVSATNRDLEREIERGAFRRDLYFRLNGIALWVPPLRERIDEIADLARWFIAGAWSRLEREAEPLPGLSPAALEHLERHPWPGNIRELRNTMELAVLLSSDGVIDPDHLPAALQGERSRPRHDTASVSTVRPDASIDALPATAAGRLGNTVKREVAAVERRQILEALEQCAGNQTQAATWLGISRATLAKRLDLYEIKRPRKPRP